MTKMNAILEWFYAHIYSCTNKSIDYINIFYMHFLALPVSENTVN